MRQRQKTSRLAGVPDRLELQRTARDVLAALRRHRLTLELHDVLPDVLAYGDYRGTPEHHEGTIRVALLRLLVATVFHEVVHHVRPTLVERDVRRIERAFMRTASRQDLQAVLRLFRRRWSVTIVANRRVRRRCPCCGQGMPQHQRSNRRARRAQRE